MFTSLRADTSYAAFEVKDGILCCTLKPDLILDQRTAQKVNDQRLRLVKETTYPTMVVIHKQYLHLEKAGFQYFGTAKGLERTAALAVVIQQPLRSILTNFSLMFHRHSVPFRVFTNTAEARLWLFEYADQEMPLDGQV